MTTWPTKRPLRCRFCLPTRRQPSHNHERDPLEGRHRAVKRAVTDPSREPSQTRQESRYRAVTERILHLLPQQELLVVQGHPRAHPDGGGVGEPVVDLPLALAAGRWVRRVG